MKKSQALPGFVVCRELAGESPVSMTMPLYDFVLTKQRRLKLIL